MGAGESRDPRDELRQNKRQIDRAIRDLDRERMKSEREEKMIMAEIKKLAKEGQQVPVLPLPSPSPPPSLFLSLTFSSSSASSSSSVALCPTGSRKSACP